MPYIQFNDQRFPLTAAELTVGAYDGAALRLPGDDSSLRAVLLVGADGTGLVVDRGVRVRVHRDSPSVTRRHLASARA